MLALTRKIGQSIMIGDEIEITVVEVKGDQVRLGIKAPAKVSIYRQEIYQEIRTANRDSVTPHSETINGLDDLLADALKKKKS